MLSQMSPPAQAALFAACERNMNALVRKGSKRCWKAVRAMDRANTLSEECLPADRLMARETRKMLRARCGLCLFRKDCKAPLDMD